MPSLLMLMQGRGCPVRASSCDAATVTRLSYSIRCRNEGYQLARAARLFALRQPEG
jgi:hypothetical protein